MKILIAYDGSDCAEAALDDLRRAGLPHTTEALVMSVEEFVPVMSPMGVVAVIPPGLASSGLVSENRTLPFPACQRLRHDFPTWQIGAEAELGHPSACLLAKAEEWQPDLIVVGSHGRSAWRRFILGCVSQKIVTEAHCSVRVARGRAVDARAAVRLVIGVDGSPGAEAAVREVAARVWPVGSEVRMIAVRDDMVEEVMEYVDAGWSWLQDTLAAAGKTLRAAGLAVTPQIKKGDPKHVLVQEAEDWEADCIFLGARSLSRFERFRLGSVSAAVTARAHCSVEAVR